MVEFTRTITQPEVTSGYLNLTDERGQKQGDSFPSQHLVKIAIIDGHGRVTIAKKHHGNQIWGGLSKWFVANNVQPGVRIRVRHDPNETRDALPVVHLLLEGEATGSSWAPTQVAAAVESRGLEPEIPLSLEKQLEDFLAVNLGMLEPGLRLFRDEEGREGKQYPTDVGIIDLLCRRPDGCLLVVELKRARTSDVTVGQVSRYMGWVKQHVANGGSVAGLILAHDRDDNLKYAVAAHSSITVRYFKLRLQIVAEEELG